MTRLGYKFYYVFCVCNFTNALFFYFFLPETARVPLEHMDKIFSGPWFVPGTGSARMIKQNTLTILREDIKGHDVVTEHREIHNASKADV